ncbi:hypothetical protein LINPERPRIM_LOCUS9709 [Linum perenne]
MSFSILSTSVLKMVINMLKWPMDKSCLFRELKLWLHLDLFFLTLFMFLLWYST